MYVHYGVPEAGERDEGTEKHIWKNNGWKFLKDKKLHIKEKKLHKHQAGKTQKRFHTETQYSQIVESQRQRETWKQ